MLNLTNQYQLLEYTLRSIIYKPPKLITVRPTYENYQANI